MVHTHTAARSPAGLGRALWPFALCRVSCPGPALKRAVFAGEGRAVLAAVRRHLTALEAAHQECSRAKGLRGSGLASLETTEGLEAPDLPFFLGFNGDRRHHQQVSIVEPRPFPCKEACKQHVDLRVGCFGYQECLSRASLPRILRCGMSITPSVSSRTDRQEHEGPIWCRWQVSCEASLRSMFPLIPWCNFSSGHSQHR